MVQKGKGDCLHLEAWLEWFNPKLREVELIINYSLGPSHEIYNKNKDLVAVLSEYPICPEGSKGTDISSVIRFHSSQYIREIRVEKPEYKEQITKIVKQFEEEYGKEARLL